MNSTRKQKLLQAAMEEFASQGYAKASTNHIAAGSGTSKGLLFHYFGCKENLYLECIQCVLDSFEGELDRFVQGQPQDFFARMEKFLKLKRDWLGRRETEYRLLQTSAELPPTVAAELNRAMEHWSRMQTELTADIDWRPWNPAVNPTKTVEMVRLLFEGLDRRWLHCAAPDCDPDLDAILEDGLAYLKILRQGAYRQDR